jgi:hypothetical protein
MIGIRSNARRRAAIGLFALLCAAAFPLSGNAAGTAGGDLHIVSSSATTPIDPSARTALVDRWLRIDARHAEGLTLTIGRLPASRRTIRQLATYYYGAPEMSFVLQAANPWLAGFRLDQSFSTYSGHPAIHVPTLGGARPIGPE